jgi:hypothetical protein
LLKMVDLTSRKLEATSRTSSSRRSKHADLNDLGAIRDLAIRRGLNFIYRSACVADNFEVYGHDFLFCFHCIASTSSSTSLIGLAREMGRERARYWRRQHSALPSDAHAETIAGLVIGSDAADRLGVRDTELKHSLRNAAANFDASDFLGFDPAREPPPADIPDECECGEYNRRGRKSCRCCKRQLAMMSRYGAWVDAIIRSYIGERFGARLGASFADVIKWLPVMRPYPRYGDGNDPDFYWAMDAVSHVVYALNDYSRYQLSPACFPDEYAFLLRNLKKVILMEDPEMLGEFLDALKSFGLSESHPLILEGMRYLVTQQNSDGSWGDSEVEDIYYRYHPTWTAIDGLREYAWRGQRLTLTRPLFR